MARFHPPAAAGRLARLLTVVVLVAAVGSLAGGCAGRPAPTPFEQGADRYRFEISLMQSPDTERAVAGEARVTDLASGQTLSAPRFVVAWGESAEVSSEDHATGEVFHLKVTVDPRGQSADYRAEVTKGGRLIASRQATAGVDPARR